MRCRGIAELKWIAEFADLHGVLIAPHGTGNGLLGLAALVQVCATLPNNFIAFEYPSGNPAWWYDIVDGLPDPIVQNGLIEVWDRPGMGVEINPEKAETLSGGRGCRVLRLSNDHQQGQTVKKGRVVMQSFASRSEGSLEINRRNLLGAAGAAALAGALPGSASAQGSKTGIDAATWTPQYIASIAGTAEYDTRPSARRSCR